MVIPWTVWQFQPGQKVRARNLVRFELLLRTTSHSLAEPDEAGSDMYTKRAVLSMSLMSTFHINHVIKKQSLEGCPGVC